MSYILEALRKADAERDRGSVPDLHAQMLPTGTADDEPPPPLPVGRWAGLGLLLALLAGGGWWWLRGDEPTPPPTMAMQAPPTSAAALPAPALAPPAIPTLPAAKTQKPQPVLAPTAPQSVPTAPVVVLKPAVAAAAKPLPKVAAAPASTPAVKMAVAPASTERVPPLAELAGDLRQQVPALAIGGSVYSPQASARMVVVNGQVFQEGAQLAPELKLEQIRPKSAVFSIRGQRFEVPL